MVNSKNKWKFRSTEKKNHLKETNKKANVKLYSKMCFFIYLFIFFWKYVTLKSKNKTLFRKAKKTVITTT